MARVDESASSDYLLVARTAVPATRALLATFPVLGSLGERRRARADRPFLRVSAARSGRSALERGSVGRCAATRGARTGQEASAARRQAGIRMSHEGPFFDCGLQHQQPNDRGPQPVNNLIGN